MDAFFKFSKKYHFREWNEYKQELEQYIQEIKNGNWLEAKTTNPNESDRSKNFTTYQIFRIEGNYPDWHTDKEKRCCGLNLFFEPSGTTYIKKENKIFSYSPRAGDIYLIDNTLEHRVENKENNVRFSLHFRIYEYYPTLLNVINKSGIFTK